MKSTNLTKALLKEVIVKSLSILHLDCENPTDITIDVLNEANHLSGNKGVQWNEEFAENMGRYVTEIISDILWGRTNCTAQIHCGFDEGDIWLRIKHKPDSVKSVKCKVEVC